jgi:hypothetical protein
MWDIPDKQNYDSLTQHNLGQICNDEFAIDIQQYACEQKLFIDNY